MENHILAGLLKSRAQVSRWGTQRTEKTWSTTRAVDYCLIWREQQKQRCLWKVDTGRKTAVPHIQKSSQHPVPIKRTSWHLHSESQIWNTRSGRPGIPSDVTKVPSHQYTDGLYSTYISIDRVESFILIILHMMKFFPFNLTSLFRCARKLY